MTLQILSKCVTLDTKTQTFSEQTDIKLKPETANLQVKRICNKKKVFRVFTLFDNHENWPLTTDKLTLKSHFYRSEFFPNAFLNCKLKEPYSIYLHILIISDKL